VNIAAQHDAVDRVAEIERLAALDPLVYEATRAEAAKQLRFRATALDQAVKKKRRELGLDDDDDDDDGQGQAVKIADPMPWHEPVDGDRLATALTCALRTYVALPDAAADAISLWALLSWCFDAFYVSPRLAITSPTKGCGKTTVLRFLNHVTRRAERSGSVTPAALFRFIEKFRPTFLLDENEKYLEPNSETHALLNEGHIKGSRAIRVLGENQELRAFNVFGPVAFCRNGRLPDDLAQRSIVINMQRRTHDDQIAELREDRCENLKTLARMCCRWADDNIDALREADPEVGFINRDADNWRPLFAIADQIGSDWPQRIREAAEVLTPRESESIGPMLLADIKAIFEDKDADWLASVKLCDTLATIESRPWADWKAGKPLTPNQLARLLRPFGIHPDNQRTGEKVLKGYHRHQFKEAWERYLTPKGVERYLTPKGVNEPLHRYNAAAAGTSAHFPPATPEPDVAFQKCEKAPSDGHCSGVASQEPEKAHQVTKDDDLLGFSWRTIVQLTRDVEEWVYSCRHDDGATAEAQIEAEARRRVIEAGVLPEFAKIETDRVLSYLYKTEEARRHTVRQWIQYETKAPSERPAAKRCRSASEHEMQDMIVAQANRCPQRLLNDTGDELKGGCHVDRLSPA
jgi:putative DNA primase/helicase